MACARGIAFLAQVVARRQALLPKNHPDGVAGAMQRVLSDEFEVDVACVVRTAVQVRGVLERNPLQEAVSDPSRYLVVFLSQEPDPEAVEALLGEDHSPEAIAIEGAEAYVWSPDGVKAMTLSYAYGEGAPPPRSPQTAQQRAYVRNWAEPSRGMSPLPTVW